MAKQQRQYSPLEIKISLALLCAGMVVFLYFFLSRERPEQSGARREARTSVDGPEAKKQKDMAAAQGNAFGLCRNAILTVARDPKKSEVPYMLPVVENGNWVWSWRQQTKMLRLRNGLGLEVAATGLCAVDMDSMHIEMLIVDDKIVLSPSSK